MRRSRATVAAAITIALTAGFATQAFAYAPGKATPHRPVYSSQTGGWTYHCNFSGWRSGVKVVWKCDLVERSMNELGFIDEGLVQKHSGSWTPGSPSRRTKNYFKPLNVGDAQYCVKTYAYSADGASLTKYACN